MKKFNRSVACILMIALVFCMVLGNNSFVQEVQAEDYNLVQNPGFESGTTSPDFWIPCTGFENRMEWDSTQKYEGQKSLKLMPSSSTQRSIYDQLNIPVKPNTKYVLSGYCMTENWTGTGTLELYIYDASNKFITGAYKAAVITGNIPEWKEIVVGELVTPEGAKTAKVRMNAMKGTGSVWYDNIELKEVVEEGPDDLGTVTLSLDKTDLTVGESIGASISGTLNNGEAADLSNAEITLSSDNPNVAVVENNNGWIVKAVGPGTAGIKVVARLNNVAKQAIVTVNVAGVVVQDEYMYDFKLSIDSTLETAGWRIADDNISYVYPGTGKGYRNQVYGIQVFSNVPGEYLTFDFNVPVAGYYTVKFIGAGAGGGAVANIIVDGEELGNYDFYQATYTPAQDQLSYKTLELTAGVHQLKLIAVSHSSGSWGYNMYPAELKIQRKESLPTLESVLLSSSRNNMVVGQTAIITAKGLMSDGYTDLLKGNDSNIVYESLNPAAVTVDQNGIVRAVGAGNSDIKVSVTMNGVTRTEVITVIVNEYVLDHVDLTLGKDELPAGLTTNVVVNGFLNDESGTRVDLNDAVIAYSSLNEDVAIIDSKGTITTVAEGTATIRVQVTLGNTTVVGEINISVVPVILESIEVSSDKSELFVGRCANISITGKMNDGNDADFTSANITYESNNETVAAVESGIVSAKVPGAAVITITVDMDGIVKSGSVEITVVDTTNIKSSKKRTTFYTAEKVNAARSNIEEYDWAKSIKEGAVTEANKYVDMADLLWNAVAPQSLPRSYSVNQYKGCPVCGDSIYTKYGAYPWIIDTINDPWKLKCPECGLRFPTNDFGAYYKSGLDEHGIFNPNLADKSLLVNTLYPEKGEKWGVDDGYGYIDENGNKYTFIAYYIHWGLWDGGMLQKALDSLRDAYLYTGDTKYARTGIILLDRIADVYPDMDCSVYKWDDGYLNSHGGTGQGKILGSIWETDLVSCFIKAYDAFFPATDDPEVINFLIEKSAQYDMDNPKNTGDLIRKNIEDGILRQVYPGVKDNKIRGNMGMHQSALALAAVVLDTNPETKEWLDFDFQAGGLVSNKVTGGNILPALVNDVDRDGHGNEAAPGYNRLWLDRLKQVADVLDGYDGYPEADLYKNPKFMEMFSASYPLILCERYTAQIGDSGGTGNPGLFVNMNDCITGFEKFGDPVLAQLAYFLNNNSVEGIHSSIFSANPDAVREGIQNVINEKGTLKLDSTNLTGYGFGVLRDGENAKKYFGYNINFPEMDVVEASAGFRVFTASGTVQMDSVQQGDYITFKFSVPKTDTYEVNLNPFKASSYGIYDINIDGEKLTTIDFYGNSGASSNYEVLAKIILGEGEHEIKFSNVGKNEASSNYKLGVIQLVLYDQEALDIRDSSSSIDSQRDFWMYYGRNTGHGHKDTLNLGVHAYGLDIAPELGYPEYTGEHPKRLEWTSNTISHNTVVVDASKQGNSEGGFPYHFDNSEYVKVMDVDAPAAYAQTEMYRRTVAMIKVNDEISYGVDFFRVKGGNDHYYSFHGTEGTVTTEGLNLVAQSKGTYAGENIEFGQRYDSVAGWGYMGSGFHYLKNVERDTNPADTFSIDWDIIDGRGVLPEEEDIHLRLTMVGQINDVAIADGEPPHKPGNPENLKYMIAHRSGNNLNSLFTSVIEPYKEERYIENIVPVTVTKNGQIVEDDVKAVKVVLKNGRVDYIVSALDKNSVFTIDNKFDFQGFLGVYSEKDGKQIYGYVNDGTMIGNVKSTHAGFTGTVTDFTRTLSINNEIIINMSQQDVKAEDLVGRYIYIENDGKQNAVYKIEGIKQQDGSHITCDIGGVTLIRSLADVNDFSKGFIYNIAQGAQFTIPLDCEEILLNEVTLTSDKDTLTRGETANLQVTGKLSDGEDADLKIASIKYISSDPDVVSIENGVVTAHNAGTVEVYAEVTLGSSIVISNVININVTVSIPSIRIILQQYEESGEVAHSLAAQLKNKLDQSEHFMNKGDKEKAIKHMKDFLEHLDINGMQKNISDEANSILKLDADAFIEMLENQ